MFNHSLFHPKLDDFGPKKISAISGEESEFLSDWDQNDSATEIFALTWENLFV